MLQIDLDPFHPFVVSEYSAYKSPLTRRMHTPPIIPHQN
ncbi:unnamed protein product [Brassica rapa subsp. trilocularis]